MSLMPQPVPPIGKLLSSSIRGQTEEARTTIPQPPEQKPQSQKANQNDRSRWGNTSQSGAAREWGRDTTCCRGCRAVGTLGLRCLGWKPVQPLWKLSGILLGANHVSSLRPSNFSPQYPFNKSACIHQKPLASIPGQYYSW